MMETASTNSVITISNMPPIDLTKIETEYLCPECKSILVEAHQAYDCGCRFCFICLDKIVKNGGKNCPSCGMKLLPPSLIPDKYFQKKTNNIDVACTFDGCQWNGKLLSYRDHYNNIHFISKCEYCQLDLKSKDEYDKHLNRENGSCLKQPIECIYTSIGCMEDLNKDSGMEVTTASTQPHSSNDITYKSFNRESINQHMSENTTNHLELLFNYTNKLGKDLNEKIDSKYSILSENVKKLTQKFDYLNLATINSGATTSSVIIPNRNNQSFAINQDESINNNVVREKFGGFLANPVLAKNNTETDDSRFFLEKANTGENNLNIAGSSFNNRLEWNDSKVSIDQSKIDSDRIESDKRILELKIRIETLENSQKSIITDLNRLQKTSEKLKLENQVLKDNIKDYKNTCQELHKTLALTQVSLLTLEERLINQEKLSYNGTLLWKITNVHERIQEAKTGRQTSFYSPPFYTDKNGFKMCARIYLNGDGNGRNTHLSLFFVILRGEFDSLLRWPFRQKVTFILIDQSMSESKENIYDAFRPDPNSSSFKRPISEMNIASGLPVFCQLGKLMSTDHEYIKDNTMFIKIIVDTKDLTEI